MIKAKHLLIFFLIFSIIFMPVSVMDSGYAYAAFRKKSEQVKVKKGTDFDIALQTTINSANLYEKGIIAASLEEDIIYKSNLIAPQGSIVYGEVQKVKSSRGFYGKGYMQITFDEIILPNGEVLNFSGNIIKIKARGNRALKIGGDLLLGIISGAILGPVGAAIGLLMATIEISGAKGLEVEIPAGTALTIRLIKPLKTVPYA